MKSAELRKGVSDIMKDGARRNLTEIKEKLLTEKNAKYGEDFTEGQLAGIMRGLRIDGELEAVERGIYQRPGVEEAHEEKTMIQETRERAHSMMVQQCNYINQQLEKIKVSEMSVEDFENAKYLVEVKENLEKMLQKK